MELSWVVEILNKNDKKVLLKEDRLVEINNKGIYRELFKAKNQWIYAVIIKREREEYKKVLQSFKDKYEAVSIFATSIITTYYCNKITLSNEYYEVIKIIDEKKVWSIKELRGYFKILNIPDYMLIEDIEELETGKRAILLSTYKGRYTLSYIGIKGKVVSSSVPLTYIDICKIIIKKLYKLYKLESLLRTEMENIDRFIDLRETDIFLMI